MARSGAFTAGQPFLRENLGPRRDSPPGDLPFPVRDGCRVTPLLLSADMYPDLERCVLGATRNVYLAFRIFDPETRSRSSEAAALGLADWTAILRHVVVHNGVTVRLLLTDFEPTMAHDLHGLSWSSFRVLEQMAAKLAPETRDRFEMIVAQHPGEVGWGVRQLLRVPVGLAIRKVLRGLVEAEDPTEKLVEVRPGLWRYHRFRDGKPIFRRGPAPRLWPATHHHKFAVIDDSVAIIGGIDVNERRWETRRYAQPADETWHDVSARLEGPAAADAAEHFRALWNAELPRFVATTRDWLTDAERELVIEPLDTIDTPPAAVAALPDGGARVQLLRTRSRRSTRMFAVGPVADVHELMLGYRNAIFSAEHLLYIEAQFFRYQRAAGWIAEQAARHPALRVIIVMPQAPDDVAFGGERQNPAHRHGEYLQSRALGALRKRLGDRIGLFSLAKKSPLTAEEREFVADRGGEFGSGMIYVHSKLLIADDKVALVSSANINNRSFRWDSEFGLMWQDAESIPDMRQRLWSQLLELGADDLPGPGDELARWRAIADRNVTLPPADRQGFVVPYRYAKARRFGRPAWFVPDDLV